MASRPLLVFPCLFGLLALLLGLLVDPQQSSPPTPSARISTAVPAKSGSLGTAWFITAHPDDETMFFSPSILSLARHHWEIKGVCLSTGNDSGLGTVRFDELKRAYARLGVPEENVKVVDHSDLQDGPGNFWRPEVIAGELQSYALEEGNLPDIIITFDQKGVSGHPNHGAIHHGVQRFLDSLDTPNGIQLWLLKTHPIHRKFIAFLSASLQQTQYRWHRFAQRGVENKIKNEADSWTSVNSVYGYTLSLDAMRQHPSQLVWFRWLYVAFSRYMWDNHLLRVR